MLKYVQSQNNEDLPQQVASKFIESPDFERYLKRLRLALSNQRAEVTACILDHFPEGTKVNEPNGGLFLWVELPNSIDSKELFETCLAEQILIAPGAMFANSNQFKNFVRINCGWPFSPEIERTLKRIGDLCKQMQLAG